MNDQHQKPGHLIHDLMEERGLNQRVISIVLGIHETIVNKVISGRRRVDAEMAIGLGELFQIDPVAFLDVGVEQPQLH